MGGAAAWHGSGGPLNVLPFVSDASQGV